MNSLLVLNQTVKISWEHVKGKPAENSQGKEEECLYKQVPSPETVNWYIAKVITIKEAQMKFIIYHGKHDNFHKKLKQIGKIKHSHLLHSTYHKRIN